MPTDDTSRRILDAALALFNERGVGTVSTRAIADRAGLSSGNLHYHFANKQAVVQALLERRRLLTDPIWAVEDGVVSLDGFEEMLRQDFRLAWEYRFLHRELVTFTLADPAFAAQYTRNYRERIDQLRTLLSRLVDEGLLDLSAQGREDALTLGWSVRQNWLVHLETIGVEVTEQQFTAGARLVMKVLDPRSNL
jgi:AcrR family transcriptional regulator